MEFQHTCLCACVLTQYPNKNVALVASDILHLLISYVDHLQKFPPDTPKKIVEVRRTHTRTHARFCYFWKQPSNCTQARDARAFRCQVCFSPRVIENRSLPGFWCPFQLNVGPTQCA